MTATGEKGELRGTEYLVCKQIIRDHDEFANFCVGYFMAEDFFRSFQFKLNIFYNNYFEFLVFQFWTLIEAGVPDLVLLDLGLGGSTTIGVDICRNIFASFHPSLPVRPFS